MTVGKSESGKKGKLKIIVIVMMTIKVFLNVSFLILIAKFLRANKK